MDNNIIQYLTNNWVWFVLGFMVLEKMVKLSPAKWDDILVDGIKDLLKSLKKKPA